MKSSLSDSMKFSGTYKFIFDVSLVLEKISLDKIFEAVTQTFAIRFK